MLEVVERGATLLDEKVPGWESKIDLDTLSLESMSKCVLGQLFAEDVDLTAYENGWSAGMRILFDDYESAVDGGDHYNYGFDQGCDGASYSELDDAWKEFISSRMLQTV